MSRTELSGRGPQRLRRGASLLAILLVIALAFGGCATSAPAPVATDTPVSAPTDTPVPAPTDTPVPAPTDTPVPAPTDTPVSEPSDTPEPETVLAPSVTVVDQDLVDGTLTVAEVVSTGPGWIVIHAEAEGQPGPVIGQSPVADGINTNVVVAVDPAGATETVYAMLHTDAGEAGTYEFPGPDSPVTVDDQVIAPAFGVTGGLPPRQATFIIVPDQSEARFTINELLFGNPKTVVGTTSMVEGEIAIDLGNYSQTSVSPIRINARDLTTDNNFRNNAIRRFILQSEQDQYQYIQFQPTSIDGLPQEAVLGEPFSFTVTGDLTIRDISRPETFELTVTPVSESEIRGSASTTVRRADYNLEIPNVENVADVTDEVGLAFDFVAVAGQ